MHPFASPQVVVRHSSSPRTVYFLTRAAQQKTGTPPKAPLRLALTTIITYPAAYLWLELQSTPLSIGHYSSPLASFPILRGNSHTSRALEVLVQS